MAVRGARGARASERVREGWEMGGEGAAGGEALGLDRFVLLHSPPEGPGASEGRTEGVRRGGAPPKSDQPGQT